MKGKPMTEGQPWKHILKFARPLMAGSLLQQLYNTVDTVIVGKDDGMRLCFDVDIYRKYHRIIQS